MKTLLQDGQDALNASLGGQIKEAGVDDDGDVWLNLGGGMTLWFIKPKDERPVYVLLSAKRITH